MERDLIRFYGAWLRRAFEGWHKRVEGWASLLALALGGIPLVVKLPASLQPISNAIPSIFFFIVFLAIVLVRMLLTPYWLYRDERMHREEAENARRPTLRLMLTEPPVTSSISIGGNTSETLGGTRYTVIRDSRLDVIAILCRNTGESTAKNCRARIMSAVRLQDDGVVDLGVIESVSLPWRYENPEDNLVADIPAFETTRIWVCHVRQSGHLWLFRNIHALPIAYHRLLGNPGRYRLIIQVDAENVAPQQILVEIEGREGPRPQSGVYRGEATVRLLAQAAPMLNPPFALPSNEIFEDDG